MLISVCLVLCPAMVFSLQTCDDGNTVDADGCALATTPCIAEAWAQVDVLAAFASVGVDLLEGLRVL